MNDETMTLPEAARYLGLKSDSLRRQAGRGVLRAHKKGRDWLVEKSEVERYARENRRTR